MNRKMSLANVSFNFLAGSADFLNIVLNNINSCVLLLNNNMELQAYNDSIKTIFADKDERDILYKKCGEVIGCAYAIEEAKECGTTSHCDSCDLRLTALDSYLNDKFICKKPFSRPFYNTQNQKVMKHLQFSTRLFYFKNDKYIILLIEDITELTNLQIELKSQLNNI